MLRRQFPALIHCRISGFGADGPLGAFPGYDAVIQAMAGWFSVNGTKESGPTRVGLPLVDMGTGLYSAVAILMALLERTRSGRGQFIDMALYDAGLALMHPHIANHCLGRMPELTGNAHPNASPYDRFRTRTVDVFLAIGNDRAFGRLCGELGSPELADDVRFRTNQCRVMNRDVLTEVLQARLLEMDGEDLCRRLLTSGVAAGPVQDVSQAMAHPHTLHREMAVSFGEYSGCGLPMKFSRTPGAIRRYPPRYGEHGREILSEFGFAEAEVEELVRGGVLVEHRR